MINLIIEDVEHITNEISLIPATDKDLVLIIKAELFTTFATYATKELSQEVEDEIIQDAKDSLSHTRVINYNEEPIGILQAYELEGYWYIGEIYLIEEYRGQGIGREVLEYEINNHKDKTICLNVYKNNTHVIELYKSLGFEVTEDSDGRYIMKLFPETNERVDTVKLYIKEGLKQVDSDMFITDYVGDVVNLFINKPKPYRVVYNKIDDVYGIGDAYKYIHGNIQDALIANGYGDTEFYHDANYGKHHQVKDFTFVPYLTTDNSWEVMGFEGERSNPLYIKTGIILSNYDLKTTIPDLYNKLKNNKWLRTTNTEDVIKLLRVYSKELEHLRKQEKNYLKQFQDAGFNVRPEYKGIPNFKYYIDLINSNSNRVWWLGNEPHVMINTVDMFYYPEDREERMDFIGELGKVGGEEGGLEYDLNGNLSIQCNKYTQIKKLLDDANLPYDVAFKYV